VYDKPDTRLRHKALANSVKKETRHETKYWAVTGPGRLWRVSSVSEETVEDEKRRVDSATA